MQALGVSPEEQKYLLTLAGYAEDNLDLLTYTSLRYQSSYLTLFSESKDTCVIKWF